MALYVYLVQRIAPADRARGSRIVAELTEAARLIANGKVARIRTPSSIRAGAVAVPAMART